MTAEPFLLNTIIIINLSSESDVSDVKHVYGTATVNQAYGVMCAQFSFGKLPLLSRWVRGGRKETDKSWRLMDGKLERMLMHVKCKREHIRDRLWVKMRRKAADSDGYRHSKRFELEEAELLGDRFTLAELSPQTSRLFRGCAGRQALHWANLPSSH